MTLEHVLHGAIREDLCKFGKQMQDWTSDQKVPIEYNSVFFVALVNISSEALTSLL